MTKKVKESETEISKELALIEKWREETRAAVQRVLRRITELKDDASPSDVRIISRLCVEDRSIDSTAYLFKRFPNLVDRDFLLSSPNFLAIAQRLAGRGDDARDLVLAGIAAKWRSGSIDAIALRHLLTNLSEDGVDLLPIADVVLKSAKLSVGVKLLAKHGDSTITSAPGTLICGSRIKAFSNRAIAAVTSGFDNGFEVDSEILLDLCRTVKSAEVPVKLICAVLMEKRADLAVTIAKERPFDGATGFLQDAVLKSGDIRTVAEFARSFPDCDMAKVRARIRQLLEPDPDAMIDAIIAGGDSPCHPHPMFLSRHPYPFLYPPWR